MYNHANKLQILINLADDTFQGKKSFTKISKKNIYNSSNLYSILVAIAILIAVLTSRLFSLNLENFIVITVTVIAFSYLAKRMFLSYSKSNHALINRTIAFQLPIVIEQILMAVESGHDVLPAIKIVVSNSVDEISEVKTPVLWYFNELVGYVNSGYSYADSTKEVINLTSSAPLKHALTHLNIAYQHGSGVSSALKELGQSTQSFYEESIEEEIATLPIKATLPLVLTFSGLLIILITAPIIEVLDKIRNVNF